MNLSRLYFADRGEELGRQVERKPHGFTMQELKKLSNHPDEFIMGRSLSLLKTRLS